MLLGISPAAAQSEARDAGVLAGAGDSEVVSYPATFFSRYQPTTALDMVEQVPGFQLNDGSGERGFGVAAGNILINHRRPSAKQDPPSEILARIPAGNVRGIELIRGQVEGIDLRGQLVVANILLLEDAPVAVRWETSVRKNLNTSPLALEASLSLSDRWADADYNLGLEFRRPSLGMEGWEDIFDADGDVIETREDTDSRTNAFGIANLNAARSFGETLVQMNTELFYRKHDTIVVSNRFPTDPAEPDRDELFGEVFRTRQVELGLDAERALSQDLIGKAIFLFFHDNTDARDDQRVIEEPRNRTLFRVADSETRTTEAITRLEFDWIGWADHAVQFNAETALNVVDGTLEQTVDTGDGPQVVDVPGSNTRVEELRGDILLKDTWNLGDWVLDYGLGAEFSEISQTGDAEQTRNFFFLKPQSVLSWSPRQSEQTRLRVAREAAQLNLNDFVSATVFQDEDLALGNPDLEPQTTWIAELSHERRFGELGVVTLTGFHHWITNVQDLLPVTDEFEVPGNIGDGRSWGVILESTLPLERAGLAGARLDMQVRWQNSSVTDPVTGVDRKLSSEGGFGTETTGFDNQNDYALRLDYRQDFQEQQVAWGWYFLTQDERTLYKVNELDIYDTDFEVDAFIETTRWWDMKIRVEANNIFDQGEIRDRTLFNGARTLALSNVDRRELRDMKRGRRFLLLFSGTF